MYNSASKIKSSEDKSSLYRPRLIQRLKIYGFAIAIILGIIGLAVVGAGLTGYFHAGTFSHLNQVYAMTMVVVGGAGGAGGVGLLFLSLSSIIKIGTVSTACQLKRYASSVTGISGFRKLLIKQRG